MSADEKPIGVAIVICDKVITESPSQNKTLVSILNRVDAANFPHAHGRLSVYVALGCGQGKREISLVVKRIRDGMEISKSAGYVELQTPNDLLELFFEFHKIVFPEPGSYVFEVLDDDDFIFQRCLYVRQVREKYPRRRW
jgi:hypothetical protein